MRAFPRAPALAGFSEFSRSRLTLLATGAALLYVPAAGAAVVLGAFWFVLPILLIFAAVVLSVVGADTAIGFVVLLTPLAPSGVRLPLLGVRTWQLTLSILVVAIAFVVLRSGASLKTVRLRTADILFVLFELLLFGSFALIDAANHDANAFAEQIVVPACLYVAGRIAFSSPRRQQWLLVTAIAALLTSVELWVEFAVGRPLWADVGGYAPWAVDGLRAGSMLQGPNFTAAYLALGLACAAVLAGRRGPRGRFALACCVLLPLTFVATRSISGVIEMSTVIGVVLLARGNWVLRAVLIAAVIPLLVPEVRAGIAQQDWFAAHDQSITTRFDMIETASRATEFLLRDPTSLLTGAGFGSWSRFAPIFVIGNNIDLIPGQTTLEDTYLTLFFEDGLPAAVLYVALLGVSVWNGWRNRHDPVRLAGGLAAMVLVIVSGSGTLTSIPQVLGLALFQLAGAHSPDPTPLEAAHAGAAVLE